MNSPDSPTFPSIPQHFEFYYGTYSRNSFYCRLGERNSLIIEYTKGGNFSGRTRTVHPDRERWGTFQSVLDSIQIWKWEPEYSTAYGCCGVTYWNLILHWDNRTISSHGANAFPGEDGQLPTPVFKHLLHGLEMLTGESFE